MKKVTDMTTKERIKELLPSDYNEQQLQNLLDYLKSYQPCITENKMIR